jgi:hypothetical protein
MPTDLPLRCRCGDLRGVATNVSPAAGTHLICTCTDCQAYAHFLERTDVLDARGGTAIFQLTPQQVRIERGADRLACVRLTARGPLRWYASCCRTPIGNTAASARMPFVGLVLACIDPAADARARDAALGPTRGTVFPGSAIGGVLPGESTRPPLRMILRTVGILAWAALRGKHRPSPFFDPASGQPVTAPKALSESERGALYERTRAGVEQRAPAT